MHTTREDGADALGRRIVGEQAVEQLGERADKITRLMEQRDDIATEIKDRFDDAKNAGYSVTALRRAIKVARMDDKQRGRWQDFLTLLPDWAAGAPLPKPVAYILGRKGFRHIDLAVDRRVLVPRPETEMLVELAREVNPETVLEVGTGSGAIALAVADELAACQVTATDVSDGAIEVAIANAGRLGLGERVRFTLGSLPEGPAGFDLILANLPYVPDSDGLPPEVGQWEPAGALFGGPDGTRVIAEVLAGLGEAGIGAPVIGLEIGQGQGELVAGMVGDAGWPETEIRLDLAGIDRVVVGRGG